ncbi:MAG: GGDEF domain-containing protein [Lachnospiraceae bacterium]|nr:GGDEF domain-containing protein [Lachnospiraceae bacterium]
MNIEDKILLEENELKPNRHVSATLLMVSLCIVFFWIINELGIFHVKGYAMRSATAAVVVGTGIAFFLGHNPKFARREKAKYIIMTITLLEVFLVVLILEQFSVLVLSLPLAFAAHYHNKKLTLYVIVVTCIIGLLTPSLSCRLGFWQADYYEFLLEAMGYDVSMVYVGSGFIESAELRIILFKGIPRVVMLAAVSTVIFSVTRTDEANLESRIVATYLSRTDILTGLFNRISFEDMVKAFAEKRPEKLTCIYADVNGLHSVNNANGHKSGDEMLMYCAEALKDTFGEMTYRIGGDEFVSFISETDHHKVNMMVTEFMNMTQEHGYYVSVGCASLKMDENIDELVTRAEKAMYVAKAEYYKETGNDRRQNFR